jgi:hypothetical protein
VVVLILLMAVGFIRLPPTGGFELSLDAVCFPPEGGLEGLTG